MPRYGWLDEEEDKQSDRRGLHSLEAHPKGEFV